MTDRDKLLDSDDAEAQPTKQDEPEDFVPESAEIEPAGGIISRPPNPDSGKGDAPTEGDKR